MTLADEDTNSILTDNANRAIQGNVRKSYLQFGASSLAKHGGAYFSAVYGSLQDPIAAPRPYENQEP